MRSPRQARRRLRVSLCGEPGDSVGNLYQGENNRDPVFLFWTCCLVINVFWFTTDYTDWHRLRFYILTLTKLGLCEPVQSAVKLWVIAQLRLLADCFPQPSALPRHAFVHHLAGMKNQFHAERAVFDIGYQGIRAYVIHGA